MANVDAKFEKFLNVPFITTRNSVRTAINFSKTKVAAIHQKEKQVVVLAHDRLSKDSKKLTPQKTKELLHAMDNKTADLAGMLSCVSGMPLVIKANLATELGIYNGTRCTLSRIVLDTAFRSYICKR